MEWTGVENACKKDVSHSGKWKYTEKTEGKMKRQSKGVSTYKGVNLEDYAKTMA